MPATPRVTVLMTLYNKGPYVEEAVHSVLAQTFTDFTLLIVDDASTDGGLDKVKAIRDPRIRILESAVNTGRAAAANRGYDAATGEYIAVLDADDLMLPERLAKQVAFLDAWQEVGALGCWGQAFGGSDMQIKLPANDAGARALSLFGIPVLYPSCMLRRSVLEDHRVRCRADWRFPGMDRLFVLEVGKHARYANLPEVLFRYRVGVQNMRHGRDAMADMLHLNRAVLEQLGFKASPDEVVLQTFLSEVESLPPAAGQVRRLARWVRKLKQMNRKLAILPVQEFEAVLEKRWHGLFHRLVQLDAWSSFNHMLLTGTVRERLGYWAKSIKDRLVL